MADLAQANSPSLAELYAECVDSFEKLVLTLSEPNCDVIRRDEVRISQIFEEYGRTKIWGDQSKADLPERVRGSLDDTLRHDDDLKSLVRGVLQRLKVLLHQATHIAQRKYDPGQDMDQDSISSVSDSDYSTDEDESQRHRIPKIRLFVQQIIDQVRSLHEISSLLRRPKLADNFIHSGNVGLEATTLQGADNRYLYLNGVFGIFDVNHIFEKVLQWRSLNDSLHDAESYRECSAIIRNALDRQKVEQIRWFCVRLARANTRRREQLQYWKTHPYDSEQSVASVNVDRDLAHDTSANIKPPTIYKPTEMDQGRAIAVPEPPRLDEKMNFLCPYCGMSLGSEYIEKQLWKRHVFRDLRPYICTFQHCHNAEKMFVSRDEWKLHEFQLHRREYVCQLCQNKCATKTEMSTHLREHYKDLIPPAQMDNILDICDREVDPSDAHVIESCILCGEEMSLSTWHDHVATHMENLSLFVLPAPRNDEETEDSIMSGKADVLGSNSYTTGSESIANSLEYLAARKEFEQLKGSLEQSLEDTEWENYLTRLSEIISKLYKHSTCYERTPVGNERFVRMQLDLVRLNRLLFGEMHPITLTSISYLASSYRDQGRSKEAESLLGPDHLDTLDAMKSMASVYRKQGRSNEAESLLMNVTEMRKTVLGPDHPDTLNAMNSLALAYRDRWKWKKAQSLFIEVMETRKKILGPDHLDTLNAMNSLALAYQGEGMWKDAELLLVKVRETRKKVLGPAHLDTISAVNNLAVVYQCQGIWEKAEPLLAQVMAVRKTVQGPNHPDTLIAMYNLARLYQRQGLWKEANPLMAARNMALISKSPYYLSDLIHRNEVNQ